tara:strand:+ start:740 stop:1378 length:639 start_codon:yes stop_codon:yes gene_type:complete
MSVNYSNYDPQSWSLGTPITAGRLQQMSTNIAETKSATDAYAKGVLVFQNYTTVYSSVTKNVINAGLTGSAYTIATLDDQSGASSGSQEITLEADRYYRLCLNVPSVKPSAAGHAGSYFQIQLVKNDGSSDVVLGTYSFMTSSATTTTARHFGGGTYSAVWGTVAGSSTPHNFKATIQQIERVTGDATITYSIPVSSTAPIQIWVEDAGAST